VLSLALLFAQLGMAVHASTHLTSDPDGAPAQQQLCGQCLSFSPLQNMVGSPPIAVFAAPVSHDRPLDCAAVADVPQRAFSAFRSRAPPSLL
jgi:hypothetical protein